MIIFPIYFFNYTLPKGEKMKGSEKRKMTLGVILMLLSTCFLGSAETYNIENMIYEQNNETLLISNQSTTNLSVNMIKNSSIECQGAENDELNVAIGPPGAKNVEQCQIINSISKSSAKKFKGELEEFQRLSPNLNELTLNQKLEQSKKMFEIMEKYNIINEEVPFVSAILNYEKNDVNQVENSGLNTLNPDPGTQGYLCVGPTLFIYYSWFDSAFSVQFPKVPPFRGVIGGMGKFINKLNITEETNPLLYAFLNYTNATYFMYAGYATVQILSGGGLGHYFSFSLVDTMFPNTFDFVGPFVGMYLLCGSTGIYIFEEQDIENPWFDLIIGLSPFLSMQMKIDSIVPGQNI